MKKLPLIFYLQGDVVHIAKGLLGKIVVTAFNGELTSGRIVETEAYVANDDKASHAYAGRRTARNEHMYGAPGTAYVYICYGMHQMFNVVTNKNNIPDAVLIRAIEPISGVDIMLRRTGKILSDHTLTRGPGNVGKALGISKMHSGTNLTSNEFFLAADQDWEPGIETIAASKRIGVSYAGEDANLPYRFYLEGNKYVSGRPR